MVKGSRKRRPTSQICINFYSSTVSSASISPYPSIFFCHTISLHILIHYIQEPCLCSFSSSLAEPYSTFVQYINYPYLSTIAAFNLVVYCHHIHSSCHLVNLPFFSCNFSFVTNPTRIFSSPRLHFSLHLCVVHITLNG